MTKVVGGEEAREISLEAFSREPSKTAYNINRRCQPSGEMTYRVVVVNGTAQSVVNVEAATGDEAADKALRLRPGQKVAYVGPATKDDPIPVIDVVDAE